MAVPPFFFCFPLSYHTLPEKSICILPGGKVPVESVPGSRAVSGQGIGRKSRYHKKMEQKLCMFYGKIVNTGERSDNFPKRD
jgi:hypothetical protein